ncbi:MAG TPA: hypothetical protein PKA06_12510, partial [Gemmatales bacterium]|nr:hypothetical protein [Gemmatales bacterium]
MMVYVIHLRYLLHFEILISSGRRAGEEDGDGSATDDLIRHAAEEEPGDAGAAVSGHGDIVGSVSLGILEDGIGSRPIDGDVGLGMLQGGHTLCEIAEVGLGLGAQFVRHGGGSRQNAVFLDAGSRQYRGHYLEQAVDRRRGGAYGRAEREGQGNSFLSKGRTIERDENTAG